MNRGRPKTWLDKAAKKCFVEGVFGGVVDFFRAVRNPFKVKNLLKARKVTPAGAAIGCGVAVARKQAGL